VTRRSVQDVRLVLTVTALFVLNVAVPRAGVLYHQHPGGEHAHVHTDDGSGLTDLLEEYWHGYDHHHDHPQPAHLSDAYGTDPAGRSPHGVASATTIENDDGAGHWHEQQQFHRAVVAAVPFVAVGVPTGACAEIAPPLHTHVAAHELRARGPPGVPLA
jgi:hypothetical protein